MSLVIVIRDPDNGNEVYTSGDVEVHTFDLGSAFDITMPAQDLEQLEDARAMRRAARHLQERHPDASAFLQRLVNDLNYYIDSYQEH